MKVVLHSILLLLAIIFSVIFLSWLTYYSVINHISVLELFCGFAWGYLIPYIPALKVIPELFKKK